MHLDEISQNTIHPEQDRVFSIRELMRLMTIPEDFKWIDKSMKELNNLSNAEKIKLLKSEEVNIRQSIGEAVPTNIFYQIANKIKNKFDLKSLTIKDIKNIITDEELEYFSSDEYRNFYKIVRNYQMRFLNIDNNSVFFFGRIREC